ncbi:MAG: hypothetical protein DWQ04_05725 [Chloroflexi bacterium]|nr:MAG: hypothetical protein DWQ04_05725 [Chloroflexota bacterium]
MLILLLAVACGPAATPEVEDVGEETAVTADTPVTSNDEDAEESESSEQPAADEPEAEPEAEPTAEPEAEPEPTDEPVVEEEATEAPETEIAATEFIAATSVAEAAELRSQDWTLGAENPRITIIEYGDFQ